METQLSFMSKEEAHKLIDSIPGDGVFILTYNIKRGMSDQNGKFIKKKKGNKYIDKAKTVVMAKSQITTLNLHSKLFTDFEEYKGECLKDGIMRTIVVTPT